jgi:amino acid adenylation domain-containing protein
VSTPSERLRSLTPEQLALLEVRLRARIGAQARSIPVTKRVPGAPLPLSFSQQRLWFLHRLQPESPLYNIFLTVRLTGSIDVTALDRALSEIVHRNEVLRTTFSQVDGSPVQCIHETADVPLQRLALHSVPQAEREAVARERIGQEIRRPFDLEHGPIIRALLVEIAPDHRILSLTMHHIVSDRWSVDVLIRDLAVLYDAFSSNTASPLKPLPLQYADFALWQRSPERASLFAQQLAWWKEMLRPPLPVADLPCDHARPEVYCADSSRVKASLSPQMVDTLIQSGRGHGATLFMTMLAATSVLLFRHTRQQEIVVGTPIVNRSAPETASLIGCFVNTLALRVDGSGNPDWRQFLGRVRSVCLDAYERQDVPFERVVEELQIERNLSEPPLFQVMFALNDAHEPIQGGRALESALVANGLTLSPFEVENAVVAADLVVRIERKVNTTECTFEYRTDLFEYATVAAMVRRFQSLLADIATEPNSRLSSLAALTPEERRQVLTEWSRADIAANTDLSITAMVRLQAQIDPGAPAVSNSQSTLTRGELDLRARRLAARLRERGIGTDKIVGVCMDRTPEMVVALLGVLYACGAYLPLDPSHPPERLQWMLEDAGAAVVLTTSELVSKLGIGKNAVVMDREPAITAGLPLANEVSADSESLAYIIYTSGSTGRPKGVAVPRRGLLNLVAWHIARYQTGRQDRMSQIAALGFDASVWEIWPALASGSELILAQENDRLSAERIWDWLRERGITITFLPTPLAEAVLALTQRTASRLRVMLTGGDRLRNYPSSALEFLLVNHYGPTEYSVVATASDPLPHLPTGGSAPSIGRPIANTEVFVLDENLEPSPPGVRGELCLGGAGLARGYLRRPDLTAERFIPHPFSSVPGERVYRTGDMVRYGANGVLEFLGRRDGQVKIRGFRVELGEIECVIATCSGVREAAVVVHGAPGKEMLAAYVVAQSGANVNSEDLRAGMLQRLPAYMVPAICVFLDRLPMSPNGKVDRKTLAAIRQKSATPAARPHTSDEQALADIWKEVLTCEYPGVHDDFFALGGHSLLATQLVSRIRSSLGIELPLRMVFEHPTLTTMAGCIRDARHAADGLTLPPLIAHGPDEAPQLSFAQRRLWFIAQLEPQNPAYNIPFALRMSGALNVEAVERALGEIVRRHETLRSRFLDREGQAVLEIAASVPPSLAQYDLSIGPPEQRENAARHWCAEEALLLFNLAEGPLFRASLLRLDTGDHILVLTLHHIAADGWSVGILAREFATLYRSYCHGNPSPLPELAIHYSDYAIWQNGWLGSGVVDGLIDHWRARLAGAETLELFTDHPRLPIPSYRAASVPFASDSATWGALQRIACDEGATSFMLLFAGWVLLLGRYSGQSDIVVGTDIAGRDQSETEGLIGFFVNQLALRLTLDSGDTFRTVLRKARKVLIDAYVHQALPFETLVEALAPSRDLSRHPLFQCKLALEDAAPALDLPDLKSSLFAAGTPTIKTDLRMAVSFAGGGVQGRIEFALDLFELSTIQAMAIRFKALLAGLALAPDDEAAMLSLISEPERQHILSCARGPLEQFPGVAVHELFEQRVMEMPNAPAVMCEGRIWSYSELNERANALASVLLRFGAGPEKRVGICLERDERAVVALLAVLKSGAAYVPMDPAFPAERLEYLANSARITTMLTVRRYKPAFAASTPHTLCLDDDAEPFPFAPTTMLPRVEPENLAYVIFTSGSTGMPKAVGIEHRNLVNYVLAVSSRLQPVRGTRLALVSSLAADLGNTTLFASLCGGGILHVIREDLASNPDDLAAYFHEHAIECIKIAPSHLAGLLSAQAPARVLPGALLVLGGEASSSAWIRQLRALRPQCNILNHYGPTETTVGALTITIHEAEISGLTLPLGTPLANVRAYVLDAAGNLAPHGIAGELYLGGAGVARAYLDAPAQTAERFLPDPFSDSPGVRMYRTGDRARSNSSGVIEFLGRIDRQVKIRGYRVEPGEIETALNRHPGVAQNTVAIIEDKERGARVAAWFVPVQGHSPSARDLRSFLEKRLPAHMVPAAFVSIPSLPLLANGKLDQRALPAPDFGGPKEETYGELRTPTEQLVARIWEDVLGIDHIGPAHNFFESGGHSLLATRVASRIREAFSVPLQVRAIFESQTLQELAGRIDAHRATAIGITPPQLATAPSDVPLPLSFSEQRLWFLQRFAPQDRSYLVPIVLRLSGELSISALEAAFTETVRRHEILRTCFPTSGDLPIRLIHPAGAWSLPTFDLRSIPGEEGERDVIRQIKAEMDVPFDLGTGPLLRTRLYRTKDQEHILLVLFHHIISDAWSSGLLLSEISRFYQNKGTPALSPLPNQYSDFAYWQRNWLQGPALDELSDWWRSHLQDAPPLELPVDRLQHGARSSRGASSSIALGSELTQALKTYARTSGQTDFTVLLAGLAAMLSRFSGQTDVSIGTSVSGRTHAALEPLLGCFVNTLVLRCRLNGNPTFHELLSRVRETTLAAWDHQELPFEKLVEELQTNRTLQSTPLFQVMFVLQNAPRPDVEVQGIRFQQVAIDSGTAKFDLTLVMREVHNSTGALTYAAQLEYRTDLFERSTIEQMLSSFRCLLSSAIHAPEQTLSSLAWLEPSQQEMLLAQTRVVAPYSGEGTVHAAFLGRAAETPSAIALEFGDRTMDYGTLGRRANQLAQYLLSLGARPDILVAICLERSAELIATLLAILKTGAAYLPLDPAEPDTRLAFILADTKTSMVVTTLEMADRMLAAGATKTVLLDRDRDIIWQQPETAPNVQISRDHLAYVMYTSGSTGTPKGVAVTHRAILRLVDGNNYAALSPSETLLQLAPVGFDASTFEIWGALLNGARLVVFPAGVPSLTGIGECLTRHRVTTLWLTAGLFRLMVDEQIASLRGVRQLLAGGDVLPTEQVRRVIKELPECKLINGYGPTENTTFTCCHAVRVSDLEKGTIPIGRQIKYTEAFVLDEDMQLVPTGARGMLYAGGDGLARGYYERPDLTAESFIPHPYASAPGARLYKTGDMVRQRADGTIEFLGRKDGQVKIRGFRVETGEIESLLASHPAVREAAVIVRDDAQANRILVAYVASGLVSSSETQIIETQILDWLRQHLPGYMIPSMVVTMDRLPLNANGKIDRRLLASSPLEASKTQDEFVAPLSPDEHALAKIWTDLLGQERISIHSNFFELGGHSLLATQLASRVERELGVAVPLQLIFENPTLAAIAETVEVLRWMAEQDREK